MIFSRIGDDLPATGGQTPESAARRAGAGWRVAITIALAATLVVVVDRTIGWSRLGAMLARADALTLASGFVLVYASYLLRAARLQDFLRGITPARLAPCLRLTLVHNALNTWLPFRSGELSFPYLLNRWFGLTTRAGVASLVVFRALDLHVLIVIALGTFALRDVWFWWLVALAVAVPPGLVWLHAQRIAASAADILRSESVAPLFERTRVLRAWVWSFVNWCVKLCVFAVLLRGFEPFDWATAMSGAIGGELASVLPVQGIAGAGTYEAGVVAGLGVHGAALEPGLGAAIGLHLFVLLCATAALLTLPLFRGRPRSTT